MTDLLVVGAGVAGLTAAIAAADAGLDVVVLYKPSRNVLRATSTAFAQGGIAFVEDGRAAAGSDDSVDLHVADTLAAGGPLVDVLAARSILSDGAAAVHRLIDWGAEFDRDASGHLLRTREGGHCRSRIVHAGGDATGAEVQRALDAAARTRPTLSARPGVARALLTDEGRVVGVRTAAGDVLASRVLLATGGAGHLFVSTTNPLGATGDGIALAAAVGAQVRDLEFVQFHPTMLYTPGARGRRPLISEAVRGEGARLVAADGTPVMSGIHPMGDLAPRDVVSDAIAEHMIATGAACVYLDARAVTDVRRRFPTITAELGRIGLDPETDLIPVAPGAHYLCGGVATDLRGATTVAGLYAAGEVARTGLHGANRLASNSLLEALVIGLRIAADVADAARTRPPRRSSTRTVTAIAPPSMRADRTALQDAMTTLCGVRRDELGLSELNDLLSNDDFVQPASAAPATSTREVEDAALTAVARSMAAAALSRVRSRQEALL